MCGKSVAFIYFPVSYQMLVVGGVTSQQHASVSQGRICWDHYMCCHTEMGVADQTAYLTQSQCTDTRLTGPSSDPVKREHGRVATSHWYDLTCKKAHGESRVWTQVCCSWGRCLTTAPPRGFSQQRGRPAGSGESGSACLKIPSDTRTGAQFDQSGSACLKIPSDTKIGPVWQKWVSWSRNSDTRIGTQFDQSGSAGLKILSDMRTGAQFDQSGSAGLKIVTRGLEPSLTKVGQLVYKYITGWDELCFITTVSTT